MLPVSSFSGQLVDSWLDLFREKSSLDFRVNAWTALGDFKNFKESYENKIPDNFPPPARATKAEKRRRELWLTEQINLALDVFWEPLARVAEQLKSEPYKEFFSNTHPLYKHLDQFYANVQDLFGDSVSPLVEQILIYFNKIAKINRYPYTNVALIGVPYRVFTQPANDRKTWMPIAHELGHHIYWNMASYSDLVEQIKKFEDGVLERLKATEKPSDDIINLIRPWIGEIFADAIGLQISGKNQDERQVFVDTCKELILRKTDNEKSNMALDDGDHVPDGLRLLVPLASLGVNNQIEIWRKFLESEVGQKADDIEINLRDKDGHPVLATIKATEVADHICNTVKIILQDIANFKAKAGELFTISSPLKELVPSTPGKIANQIVDDLIRAAEKLGQDDPDSTLTFALNPPALEGEHGGGPKHTHTRSYGGANTDGHTHPNETFKH